MRPSDRMNEVLRDSVGVCVAPAVSYRNLTSHSLSPGVSCHESAETESAETESAETESAETESAETESATAEHELVVAALKMLRELQQLQREMMEAHPPLHRYYPDDPTHWDR
ncbi:MAG: hypothetical protein QF805_09160 [Pirellulaceae bacterium]|jgi:hypothetical protein|nr:hypothetical protein [Pirellulaceae bacterium]